METPMTTVLFRNNVNTLDLQQLQQEFPQFQFMVESNDTPLDKAKWQKVEILYSSRLTNENLSYASNLRWIHSPTSSLSRLCLKEIQQRENIIVTTVGEENVQEVGEFVLAGILSFAKHLFRWQEAMQHPSTLWDRRWRRSIWSLKDRILLQIGLGKKGSEIARQAQQMRMRVWGVRPSQDHLSFHPHCQRTVLLNDLKAVLPKVDIVCIALPREEENCGTLLGKEELEAMKEDTILIVLGRLTHLNIEELARIASSGKFRGIILDALFAQGVPLTSPVWKVPQLLITPEISSRPLISDHLTLQLFHYNLRQYTYDNFNDMRNRVDCQA